MKKYKLIKTTLPSIVLILAICCLQSFLHAQTISVCSGLKDAYICPEEPVTPDAALTTFFANQYTSNPCFGLLEFDNFPGLTKCNSTAIPQNALFIHQMLFSVSSGSVGAASLQFRAKAAPVGQTNSDFITFFEGSTYITGASLSQLVEAGGTWNPNQDASFTLDLGNLPPVFSTNSILQYLGDGDLDIVIGNETGVDWICLDAVSDTCYCKSPGFTDMILHWDNGPGLTINCETGYEGIPCPKPGNGYFLTGKFECEGDSCEINPYVSWDLENPSGGHSYGSSATPYFVINLSPSQTSQNGIYLMTLTSFCGTDTCKCEFQFVVDCGDLCPCDIPDLQADVNQGFNYVLLPAFCQACFTPKALSDCDSVKWYVTNPNGTPIGTSLGNNTFCYIFPGSGTYTVYMVVTRKKPDGSNCETFVKSQIVKIFCGGLPQCDDNSFDNPTFSEGAVAGNLGDGGVTNGWTSILGRPMVVEGSPGSLDGWTMNLWGNLDTASVLTSIDAMCLKKDTGTFMLRLDCWDCLLYAKIRMHIHTDDHFKLNECDSTNCFDIASFYTPIVGSTEWFDLQIPYDITNWVQNDTCGEGLGILVKPIIYITNVLSSGQGGESTYSKLQLDNLCISGLIVAVDEPFKEDFIKVYPNPTTGDLSIELPSPATSKMKIRVVSIEGQVLLELEAEPGITIQSIKTDLLPPGIFFLQLVSDGHLQFVNKFVKQ